jgi:hypothetical protein
MNTPNPPTKDPAELPAHVKARILQELNLE